MLLKQGIYTVETEQNSYVFTKPIKRYDNLISFKEDLNSASESIKSERLECRTCDIKLMEWLDEAECLFNELEDYPSESIVDGESVSFFDAGKNEHGVFVLLEEINEIKEALTEVHYKELKAKDFRDEYECFFDGVRNDTVWDFVDRISIEEAKNLPDKEYLMVILDDLASALQQANEQYQLTYS
ncbi:MAG: hypothetical protein V5789_12720 [Colwellia sp.]